MAKETPSICLVDMRQAHIEFRDWYCDARSLLRPAHKTDYPSRAPPGAQRSPLFPHGERGPRECRRAPGQHGDDGVDEGAEHLLNEAELRAKQGVTAGDEGESETSVQERAV